jgi:LSD1 subclass zinc finger protein
MVAMISRDLLEILACPVCQTPLAYNEDKDQLKCGTCHRVYPVRDDIPVLLVDESHVEP